MSSVVKYRVYVLQIPDPGPGLSGQACIETVVPGKLAAFTVSLSDPLSLALF